MAKKPVKVMVKRLSDMAQLPKYATDGAGAFDIVATGRDVDGDTATYSTGLSFEIPQGYVMKVYSRSGHGFRDGIRLANCTGIIDSDYRGELKVKLQYDGDGRADWPRVGDRVAQAMILPIPDIEFEEVEELAATARGDGGFGSTGK